MRYVRRFGIVAGKGLALVYLAAAALRLWLPGLGWYEDWRFTRDLVGTGALLGDPLASYDTPRAFNGDGYSFSRYHLPVAVAARFTAPAAAARLADYPVRPWYRGAFGGHVAWARQDWRPGAYAARDSAYIAFALFEAPPGGRADVTRALARPGTWYALLYNADAEAPFGVRDIDLFIVDPVAGILYVVNNNT